MLSGGHAISTLLPEETSVDTVNSILLAILITAILVTGAGAVLVSRLRSRLERSYAPFGILRAAIAREKDRGRELQAANLTLESQFRERQADYQKRIEMLRQETLSLQDSRDLLDAGFYSLDFRFDDPARYRAEIDTLRERQARMVTAGQAIESTHGVKVGNSESKGRALTKSISKLMLRAYHGECDAAMASVTWKNISAIHKRILRSATTLDRLGKRLGLAIAPEYAALKLEELRLVFEHAEVKERRRETERRARAEAREEAKFRRELDAKRKTLKEELRTAEEERARVERQVAEATGAAREELEALQTKNAELLTLLKERSRTLSNAERTKKGHVYVISNIGSLGPDIIKIGMTRRDDPDDRIWELGDASVPFPFDRHLIIFHDDAPSLESELHNAFWTRRVNHANDRKEFFRVKVEEVVQYLMTKGFGELSVQYSPEAKEYEQTRMLLAHPRESAPKADS
jgi:hypothetical protein